MLLVWGICEYFRLRFGYRGNINETFPELIAFQAFFLFVIPLSFIPAMSSTFLPHEKCLILINVTFVILEFLFGWILIYSFIKNQGAAFNLRTRPLFNKKFQRMLMGADDTNSYREIQLGMQKYNPERDINEPFKQSDQFLEVFGHSNVRKTDRAKMVARNQAVQHQNDINRITQFVNTAKRDGGLNYNV